MSARSRLLARWPHLEPEWSPENPGLLLIADLARILTDGLAKR